MGRQVELNAPGVGLCQLGRGRGGYSGAALAHSYASRMPAIYSIQSGRYVPLRFKPCRLAIGPVVGGIPGLLYVLSAHKLPVNPFFCVRDSHTLTHTGTDSFAQYLHLIQICSFCVLPKANYVLKWLPEMRK